MSRTVMKLVRGDPLSPGHLIALLFDLYAH